MNESIQEPEVPPDPLTAIEIIEHQLRKNSEQEVRRAHNEFADRIRELMDAFQCRYALHNTAADRSYLFASVYVGLPDLSAYVQRAYERRARALANEADKIIERTDNAL